MHSRSSLFKMGNANSAASATQPSPKPPSGGQSVTNMPPAPPMTAPSPPVESKADTPVEEVRKNPGSYEDIHKKCRGKVYKRPNNKEHPYIG